MFQRHQRLLNRAAFQGVFDQADFKVSYPEFLILARPTADSDEARLGLIVAKKNIKTAAKRNHFKRLARESFRLNQHRLQGLDIIVMSRKPHVSALQSEQPPVDLYRRFCKAWSRLAAKRHPALLDDASRR